MSGKTIALLVCAISVCFVNQASAARIHDSVGAGDVAKVKKLLASNRALANARDSYDMTPLHHVGMNPNKAIADLLIAKGANVNAKDDGGRTPLHYAANTPSGSSHADAALSVVKLLLDKGANVNAPDKQGMTPLCMAVKRVGGYQGDKAIILLLIARGADVNAKVSRMVGQEDFYQNPLQMSGYYDTYMTENAYLLMAHGAQPPDWLTTAPSSIVLLPPLHEAAALGNLDQVREMLKMRPSLINDQFLPTRGTPLDAALSFSRDKVAQFLTSKGAKTHSSEHDSAIYVEIKEPGSPTQIGVRIP